MIEHRSWSNSILVSTSAPHMSYKNARSATVVKQQSPITYGRPQESYHITGGHWHLTPTKRIFYKDATRYWLLTYNGTLFLNSYSYWRLHRIPCLMCLTGCRQSHWHGRMVFGSLSQILVLLRLTKLSSTTFEIYQSPLANTSEVSKAV